MKLFRFLFDDHNLNSNRKRIFSNKNSKKVYREIVSGRSAPDKNINERHRHQNSGAALRNLKPKLRPFWVVKNGSLGGGFAVSTKILKKRVDIAIFVF